MKKILITGGAGFIGSNISLQLLKKGYQVTVLDSLSEQVHGIHPHITSSLYTSIADKVKFIRGSINSKEDLQKAIADNEIILHLAAETGTGQSMYQVEKYTKVNIMGTALLLDMLVNQKHNVKKVLVASSRSVYGEGKYFSEEDGVVYPKHRNSEFMDKGDFEVKYNNNTKPLTLLATDENSKLHPSSIYGITKLNQEQMIMATCKAIGIKPVAFRYQNVYGPGQSLSNPYTGILSIFSTQIKNGNEINIFEDGKESRDFIYIDDLVDATIRGIENNETDHQIFNVGTGIATNVLEVATTLMKFYNKSVNIKITGNYRLGDIRHNYADISLIGKELGFKPKVNFQQGIKKFAAWVNAQSIIHEDKYNISIQEMKLKGLYKENPSLVA